MKTSAMAFRFLLLAILLNGCGMKVELPTASNASEPALGAGDTTYIRISPDWSASNGYDFASPYDIIVGADGYLFIADHDQPAIHVLNSAGVEVAEDAFGNDFSDLSVLTDENGSPVYPVAMGQDDNLNLFIADGQNRVFVWNQYLKNVGVDSIVIGAQFNSPTGDSLWIHDQDSINLFLAGDWELTDYSWSTENIDYWLQPRVFWSGEDSLEARNLQRHYVDPDSMLITGVSSHANVAYLSDAHNNSILTVDYQPAALLMTGSGELILVYRGAFSGRAVSAGTGNMTVNDPRGLTHDKDGVMYYSQWGDFFSVHKVFAKLADEFQYGSDDIMEIGRFNMASDVSLDVLKNIYVADTGHDRIQQFNPAGKFIFNIGMSRVYVDSTIVDSVLVDSVFQVSERDTTFQIEVADVLDNPRSVAVDDQGVVYIADTGNDRVMRYRLSTELDYDTEN